MKRTLLTIISLASLGLGFCGAQTGAEPVAPAPVAACFAGDARLQEALEVAERDRPLAEWLKALSGRLGLPLTASRAVADDKLTAFLDHRPAAEVLTLVARHLELEWIKGKSGYLLAEPPEAQRRREQQRQAEWQSLQRWMERLAALEMQSNEQLSARRRAVERELQLADVTAERHRTLLEERDLLADHFRHERAVPVAVQIYRSLTPTQLATLHATGFLRLSSAYGTLSPAVVAATHQALGNQSSSPNPEGVRHAEITFTLAETARDSARRNGARQLKLYVELTAVRPERSTSMLNWRPRSPAAELPAAGGARPADAVLERPLALRLTPEHPQLTVVESGPAGYTLQQWPDSLRLSAVAEAVHRATGRELLADSFTRARLRPELLAQPKSTVELLDAVARELDYSWKSENRVLLLRSRSRAYDRAAEVPERLLQPFRRRALALPAPTLEDYAALAASLTDSQCRGLEDFWGYYLEGTGIPPLWTSGGLFEARFGLRLWASLSPGQRRQALAEILTTDRMTEPQRHACALALSAPGDDLSAPDCLRIPVPESLPGRIGGFRVKPRRVESQAFQDDKGNFTATIRTVGEAPIFSRRFDPNPPPRPVGPSMEMDAFDFLFYVVDSTGKPELVRSANLHLVPRWAR